MGYFKAMTRKGLIDLKVLLSELWCLSSVSRIAAPQWIFAEWWVSYLFPFTNCSSIKDRLTKPKSCLWLRNGCSQFCSVSPQPPPLLSSMTLASDVNCVYEKQEKLPLLWILGNTCFYLEGVYPIEIQKSDIRMGQSSCCWHRDCVLGTSVILANTDRYTSHFKYYSRT